MLLLLELPIQTSGVSLVSEMLISEELDAAREALEVFAGDVPHAEGAMGTGCCCRGWEWVCMHNRNSGGGVPVSAEEGSILHGVDVDNG